MKKNHSKNEIFYKKQEEDSEKMEVKFKESQEEENRESEDEVYKKIEEIVKKYSNVCIYEKDIKRTDDFESLGLNSLHYIKIVVDIENEFDIEFDDENLDNNTFKNIEYLSNYVKKLIKE